MIIFQRDIIKVKEMLRITLYMFCHAFVDVVTRTVILFSQRTKTEIPLHKIVVILKEQHFCVTRFNFSKNLSAVSLVTQKCFCH